MAGAVTFHRLGWLVVFEAGMLTNQEELPCCELGKIIAKSNLLSVQSQVSFIEKYFGLLRE